MTPRTILDKLEAETLRDMVTDLETLLTGAKQQIKNQSDMITELYKAIDRLRTDNQGMLNGGGYDYMSKQRNEAERRLFQATAYAEELKKENAALHRQILDTGVMLPKHGITMRTTEMRTTE